MTVEYTNDEPTYNRIHKTRDGVAFIIYVKCRVAMVPDRHGTRAPFREIVAHVVECGGRYYAGLKIANQYTTSASTLEEFERVQAFAAAQIEQDRRNVLAKQ